MNDKCLTIGKKIGVQFNINGNPALELSPILTILSGLGLIGIGIVAVKMGLDFVYAGFLALWS